MLTQEQINLAKKREYFCDSRFISGRIMEYDIRAANISMLREYGSINDEYYNYMLSVNKEYREEFVGWQIRKEKEENKEAKSMLEASETYRIIYQGIENAKLQLFEANNIQPNEVIRIANDAVYVNRPYNLAVTKFGNFIEFKQKMVAETAIKLSPTLVIFCWSDINGLNIELKGISNEAIKQEHSNYILGFIGSVLLTYERAGTVDAIHLIEDFYNDYINRRLPVQFYKELTPKSLYKIINGPYYISDPPDVNMIDISYNGNLIRELWKILISKYK